MISQFHVLFIIANYPGEHNLVAGIFYKRTIDELLKREIKVTVIAPQRMFKSGNSSFSNEGDEIGNLKIYRPFYFPIPTSSFKKLKAESLYQAVSNCIKKNRISFDIIDCRYAFPWFYIGQNISQKYNKPFVCNVIGDDINLDIFRSSFVRKNIGKALQTSDGIICVSKELQKVVTNEYGITDTHLVYDGIDFNTFEKHKGSTSKKINFKTKKITIGYVGYLSIEKGCDVLSEIIKRTHDKYNWIIVGEGPLSKLFTSRENVLLTGNLKPEDVLDTYNSMDVFLFPTTNEGVPNVLKEAAFFEVPIISTAVGGIPEMTNNGEYATLISDYKKPENFIEALKTYEEDVITFRNKSAKLKPFVIEKFNIKTNIDKLVSVYENAISLS